MARRSSLALLVYSLLLYTLCCAAIARGPSQRIGGLLFGSNGGVYPQGACLLTCCHIDSSVYCTPSSRCSSWPLDQLSACKTEILVCGLALLFEHATAPRGAPRAMWLIRGVRRARISRHGHMLALDTALAQTAAAGTHGCAVYMRKDNSVLVVGY